MEAGLDLVGLDISSAALEQLARRAPNRLRRLVLGDLSTLPPGVTYPIVIGIQVFQHGDRAGTHSNIQAAQARVAPGGLFCLSVNAVQTEVEAEHETIETVDDGSFTVRYLGGTKRGLLIHFFSSTELQSLFAEGFSEVVPLRLDRTWREPPARSQWSQWEAIWRRTA